MTHVPWHRDVEFDDLEEVHGIDSVELVSVGIDIGTTTTHLVFSRLLARRGGGESEHSSNFHVVERETTYESDIILTPFRDDSNIDAAAIDAFVADAYADAGYTAADVDTGAVIVTGEASRRENARAIADLFSEQSGKFVCATAGANLEALMSAHGAGAVDRSVADGTDVLHVDIGGGTTKLAYVVDGFVYDTASINVGAHLVEFDAEGRISQVEAAAHAVADDVDIDVEVGEVLGRDARAALATRFVELLFELIEDDLSDLAETLMVTDPPDRASFDRVTFAGGVSEYIHGRDSKYHGDLGAEVGNAMRAMVDEKGLATIELDSGIRATVLGSTQHSVQISGNTILISETATLPIRNIPMVPFVVNANGAAAAGHDHQHGHDEADHQHDEEVRAEELAASVKRKLDLYDVDDIRGGFAMGFHIHGLPRYDLLSAVADSVTAGWEEFDGEHPIVVALDTDVARSTGKILRERVETPIIVIDGVELDQFGYIDIGEPLDQSDAVPVTVKSLVFEG